LIALKGADDRVGLIRLAVCLSGWTLGGDCGVYYAVKGGGR